MKNAISKAFTLIELLTIICIIGILSAIIIPTVQKIRNEAYEKEAKRLNIPVDEYKFKQGLMSDSEAKTYKLKKRNGYDSPATTPFVAGTSYIIIDGQKYKLVKEN